MRSATVLAAGISGRLLILAPNRADLNPPQAEALPWNLPEGSMGADLVGSRRFRVALRAHFSANKSNGCCHHSLWNHPGEHHLWLITTITDEMIAEEKLSWFDASLTMTDEYRTCPAACCTHHRAVWEMPGRASIRGWQLNPWSTRHTARIVILIEEGHHNEHFKVWQQKELMLPVCLVQMRCLRATFLKRPVKEMWISMAVDFCTQRNWALHSL
ncbi:uncharacterized protein LOC121076528 isoform X1 [Cygnus olor]|uniref:uncharacterized protein LOC121076528 isoform X1 n=1 Tax=Cygnus olor TaxID=8869 RepID=UPI001ADE5E6A|nr:uncharacterized protein LOC121076528 isoform X1 [Cygnus olor]